MNITRREFGAGSFGALALTQVGCGSSALITALDVAEVLAASSIPIIQAASGLLGPGLTLAAIAYAKGIGGACAESVTELGTTDSTAVKYAKIAGFFAAVAVVSFPAGTVGEVVSIIDAIGAAIQAILQIVKPSAALKLQLSPAAQILLNNARSQVKRMESDGARIQDVMTKAAQLKGKP